MRRLAIFSLVIGFIGVIALFVLSFSARSAERTPILTDASWLAEDINGGGVIDFAQTTLTINRDGSAIGSGGCNHFRTKAALKKQKLRFKAVAATRMACAPALMNQEQKFFAVLERTRSFAIIEGKLFLRDKAGKSIARLTRQN
ncbi:META domain-containing protein [Phyllobacterium sp. 628]|uniref:META domain-containing protein n=1 Tax=Phyllobacterium sp. 628 TaxID=2718938 RepID=UPI0016624FF0|nr:META domain-containing protein [Phyllobacterium sp. 628]QND52543.1 META domain-containing protein [Phyllobacterium sp. 628]